MNASCKLWMLILKFLMKKTLLPVLVSAMLLTRNGLGQDVNKIIIGNIMLLIPGIALTNSLRDALGSYKPVFMGTAIVSVGVLVLYLVMFAMAAKDKKKYYAMHPEEILQ